MASRRSPVRVRLGPQFQKTQNTQIARKSEESESLIIRRSDTPSFLSILKIFAFLLDDEYNAFLRTHGIPEFTILSGLNPGIWRKRVTPGHLQKGGDYKWILKINPLSVRTAVRILFGPLQNRISTSKKVLLTPQVVVPIAARQRKSNVLVSVRCILSPAPSAAKQVRSHLNLKAIVRSCAESALVSKRETKEQPRSCSMVIQ